jgi:hypothetical protein
MIATHMKHLVPVALALVACSSSSTTVTPDAGHPAAEAGPVGPLGIGFYPSNIGCGLTAAALNDGGTKDGVDLDKLADVDVTSSSALSVPSDSNFSSQIVSLTSATGEVGYMTLRQSDGTKVGIYVAKSWTIEPGATMGLSGAYPIVFVALGDITVLGHIDGTSSDNFPGGYIPALSAADDTMGEGPGGGPAGSSLSTQGDSAGAGGGSYCGAGGHGGAATLSASTYGTATLVPLVGGSSGGNAAASGGQGGGAIQLVAGGSITISGSINAGGAGPVTGAGGGGSGGAILLESPTLSVTGTLAANGAGGSGGGDGMGGATGLPSAMAAQGGDIGSTAHATGGNGSAGTTLTGSPGLTNNDDVGGGGGGAGYLRVNTTSGDASLKGTLSPASSTKCVSQGKLSTTDTCGA